MTKSASLVFAGFFLAKKVEGTHKEYKTIFWGKVSLRAHNSSLRIAISDRSRYLRPRDWSHLGAIFLASQLLDDVKMQQCWQMNRCGRRLLLTKEDLRCLLPGHNGEKQSLFETIEVLSLESLVATKVKEGEHISNNYVSDSRWAQYSVFSRITA